MRLLKKDSKHGVKLNHCRILRFNPTNSEQWGGDPDGINNVVWIANSSDWNSIVGAPSDVISVTRIRYNALNGELTDADIAFNGQPLSLTGLGQFYWTTDPTAEPTKLDIQNAATHEIGHFSGLADLYNPGDSFYKLDLGNNNQGATMYGRIDVGETYKRDIHPTDFTDQSSVTNYDIGGINYMYSHLGDVNYDIVLVFDGSTNFTSVSNLNGFIPSKNAAAELISNLRIGDRVGWVNGTDILQPIDTAFNQMLTNLNQIQPNQNGGNLADRIKAAENLFAANSTNKKVIILFSAGEVTPDSLITTLNFKS